MTDSPLSGRDSLLDAAVDVAFYLGAYGSYRKSPRRAVAALKRRRPGFTPAEYQSALDSAIVLFDTAHRLTEEEYARWWRDTEQPFDSVGLERLLAERCPGFPSRTYTNLLNGIDVYYHQM